MSFGMFRWAFASQTDAVWHPLIRTVEGGGDDGRRHHLKLLGDHQTSRVLGADDVDLYSNV